MRGIVLIGVCGVSVNVGGVGGLYPIGGFFWGIVWYASSS